jgi:hypothetical protein
MAVEAVDPSAGSTNSDVEVSTAADGAEETPTAEIETEAHEDDKFQITIQDWIKKFHQNYENSPTLIEVNKGYLA